MAEAVRLLSGLTGINNYVPGMAYSAGLVHGQPTAYSLGTPAAIDTDGVANDVDGDATAGTEVAISWTADSPYGRSITVVPSGDPGAAGGVIDVYGRDYLGQPMVERFTGANGSTAILYGKKAFYTISKTKIVTAATNAITYDIGTGWRFGLPYKSEVAWVKEDGVMVPLFNTPFDLSTTFGDADTTSGGSKYLRAPCAGYITSLWGIMGSGGSTTNAATTVELGGASGTAIVGLTITLDQDGPGVLVSDAPTTAGYNANNRFRTDDPIELVHAATTGGGLMTVGVTIQPMQSVDPVLTDPATAITGDPRGSYESHMTPDGAKEIVVGILGDNSVNSSGNGGLHGIQHYFA